MRFRRRTPGTAIGLLALALAFVPPAVADGPAKPVEQWGLFELELPGPADGNPFLDVRLAAEFTHGGNTVEVDGFYAGDGVYRVRFVPAETGGWRYQTKSNRSEPAGRAGSFTVTPPGPGKHGPVQVAHTYHFACADDSPFKPIGTPIYNWIDTPDEVQEQTLQTLAAAPFNKARMLITQQPESSQRNFAPRHWPILGTPPHNWDLTRFNPEFFCHYERRVAQLGELGIEADLILFNLHGKWGFAAMDAAGDDRYVFVDEKARAVTLPGRAGMALRIRRVGGEVGEISDRPPGY